MATVKSVRAQFDATNLEAAKIILQDPATYPAGSGAAQWARLCLARLEREQAERCGPAFGCRRSLSRVLRHPGDATHTQGTKGAAVG